METAPRYASAWPASTSLYLNPGDVDYKNHAPCGDVGFSCWNVPAAAIWVGFLFQLFG